MSLMGQRTLQRSMASDSPASDDGRLTQALAHAPHGAVPYPGADPRGVPMRGTVMASPLVEAKRYPRSCGAVWWRGHG